MKNVFLLLGSNLGDRHQALRSACDRLKSRAGKIEAISSIYKTGAWGNTAQPDFYNLALRIATSLTPEALLETCLSIEANLGRKRVEKWGERVIDIDILFYDDLIVRREFLNIPHPQIPFRRFTLEPLCEIAKELVHPELNKPIAQLLEECPDRLPVTRLGAL
jgi:2-amino-4-hydroxy-6-hydroxymethyldihydropteridine diphosphokinase